MDKKNEEDSSQALKRNFGIDLNSQQEPNNVQISKGDNYDEYNANSSRRGLKDQAQNSLNQQKPKFNLNVTGLGGSGLDGNSTSTKPTFPLANYTPSNISSKYMGAVGANIDNQSQLNDGGLLSNRFKTRLGMGGIPTPLASDMSRAKFDFSGYDPKAMRKQKEPSPARKVTKKIEEDMEIFITDISDNPEKANLELLNEAKSKALKDQVKISIYDVNTYLSEQQILHKNQMGYFDSSRADKNMMGSVDAQMEIIKFQTQINQDTIQAKDVYNIFNQLEISAVQQEQALLDLQVGGEAKREYELYLRINYSNESYIIPQLKLQRLAEELEFLEKELVELEKQDIPGGYSDENDSKNHLYEIEYLRQEMKKIIESDAFESLQGKSKIQDQLNENTQISVQNALEEILQQKISEYSSLLDQNQQEEGQINIGDSIQLSYIPQQSINQIFENKNQKLEEQILQKFQRVDQAVDECESIIGLWDPQNKFICLYQRLDELCDQVEDLDPKTMDIIGNSAKQLNKTLEDILRQLSKMSFANYDKNKIDYLYEILEKAFENEEHVLFIIDRLKSLEKIHKESPNIEGSIKTLKERQKLIDITFKHEDTEIQKSKRIFLESMQNIQIQLKEITMLQKAKFGE